MKPHLLRTTLKLTALSLGTVGFAAVACNVYEDSLLDNLDNTSTTGGSGTGAVGGGGVGGGTGAVSGGGSGGGSTSTDVFWTRESEAADGTKCPSVGAPTNDDRPTSADGESMDPIYMRLDGVRFGSALDNDEQTPDEDAWRTVGLDIDGSCTKPTYAEAEPKLEGNDLITCQSLKELACKNPLVTPPDGESCRDNAIGALMFLAAESPLVGPPFSLTEADWNCAMHQGAMGFILKVSNYNGELNDPSVRLDIYSSVGNDRGSSWICTPGAQDEWWKQTAVVPNAKYTIADRSIDPAAPGVDPGQLENAKMADAAAYVRNGHIVAQLPNGSEWWFNGVNAHTPGFRLVINRSTFVGRLQQAQDDTWEIKDGKMGGAVKPGDMIQGFREIGACENLCESYSTIVDYLNVSSDALTSTTDILPDTECDGLSYAIEFTASFALPGDVVSVAAPAEKCDSPPPGVVACPCQCPALGACEPVEAGMGSCQ